MSNGADPPPSRVPLLVGVGQADRGDDAGGLEVARRFRSATPVRVVASDGEPARLVDLLASADRVWLADAVRSGAEPGTIHRVDGRTHPLPRSTPGASTHGLSLADAIGLARALDRLPRTLTVYGIEAGTLAVGAPLTSAVDRSVDEVVRRIGEEIAALAADRRGSGPG